MLPQLLHAAYVHDPLTLSCMCMACVQTESWGSCFYVHNAVFVQMQGNSHSLASSTHNTVVWPHIRKVVY